MLLKKYSFCSICYVSTRNVNGELKKLNFLDDVYIILLNNKIIGKKWESLALKTIKINFIFERIKIKLVGV